MKTKGMPSEYEGKALAIADWFNLSSKQPKKPFAIVGNQKKDFLIVESTDKAVHVEWKTESENGSKSTFMGWIPKMAIEANFDYAKGKEMFKRKFASIPGVSIEGLREQLNPEKGENPAFQAKQFEMEIEFLKKQKAKGITHESIYDWRGNYIKTIRINYDSRIRDAMDSYLYWKAQCDACEELCEELETKEKEKAPKGA